MNSRYLTNAALLLAGAFLVVVSQAFGAGVFMWLMLGVGVFGVLESGAILAGRRGLPQRGLDATIGILGAWTIVASLVFSGTVVTWLGFASGVAFVVLAMIGLTLHELVTERVVHSIEVRSAAAEPEYAGMR